MLVNLNYWSLSSIANVFKSQRGILIEETPRGVQGEGKKGGKERRGGTKGGMGGEGESKKGRAKKGRENKRYVKKGRGEGRKGEEGERRGTLFEK